MADIFNENDIDKDFYKAIGSHNLVKQRFEELYGQLYTSINLIRSFDLFDTKYGNQEEITYFINEILEIFENINNAYIDIGKLKGVYSFDFFSLNHLIKRVDHDVNDLYGKEDLEVLDIFYKLKKTFEEILFILENFIIKIKEDEENNNKNEILNEKLKEVNILADNLKNIKVHEIFEDDSEKFKNLARKYEIAFYLSLVFLFLYFFGWYIEIDTSILKFKFAEQFHGNHSATFYVQKISLLILSTTLAAFLLKRSFMNRRLADEAYRTAKELDALPRYMEGMPDEMKEKIRFDLAYKYFGNGIHHDSYTGGENLMHENIKANTEFMKVVKGVPSSTDETKAGKDKNE